MKGRSFQTVSILPKHRKNIYSSLLEIIHTSPTVHSLHNKPKKAFVASYFCQNEIFGLEPVVIPIDDRDE